MKVGVVGLGHVGLVTAACFAHVGHEVVGVDSLTSKVEALDAGEIPFYERHLDELVVEGRSSGRLRFSSDVVAAIDEPEVVFICVGTPSRPDGSADLIQVETLAWELAKHLKDYRVLVEKSTVPVTTGERIFRTIRRSVDHEFDVVSNPEFLREGSAVADTLNPSRIVIGSTSQKATDLMTRLYEPIVERSGCQVLVTDVQTAELIKHASNAFLATKISFINAVAEVCEAADADIGLVAKGMGLDPRIGESFLRAGIGYGGSCFPKDLAAFAALADELGCDLSLLRSVQEINGRAPKRLLDKLASELWHFQDKKIAVLGLAFKPGTDDMREAPSVKVIDRLLMDGADVTAYDPVATPKAKEVLASGVSYAASAMDALQGADAAIFVTEWSEFAELDPDEIKKAMRLPIVADGRNMFDPVEMESAGITYISVGRPAVHR